MDAPISNFTKDLLSVLSFGFPDPRNSDAYKMRINSIESLIRQGADPNFVCPLTEMPMLAYAIRTGDRHICNMLIDHGASLHALSPHDAVKTMMQAIKWAPHWLCDMYMLEPKYSGISMDAHEEFRLLSGIDGKYEDMPAIIRRMCCIDVSAVATITKEVGDVQIFNEEAMDVALSNESGKTRDLLRALKATGSWRSMNQANEGFKETAIPALKEKFPNFNETIDYIVRYINLSMLSEKNWFSMQPLLLVGEPGIGKTKFLSAISKATGLELSVVGCSSVTAGWVLGGSSTSWSEGKPGMIFSALRNGKSANPIIMLDEIDKLGGDPKYDGYGPLYQLLERETAHNFVDEAITLPVNCANINWIATANSLDMIPDPILQRFNVIHVNMPDHEQMLKVVVSVYRDILSEYSHAWGNRFIQDLKPEIVSYLADMPPREMRNKLLEAMGSAAGSRTNDIFTLELADFNSVAIHKKRGPGFF